MIGLAVALALGFSDPASFEKSADIGGGGGVYFTGSPGAKYDCSVCHDADPTLELRVESDPPGLFTGGYTPGQTYRLDVTLGTEPSNGGFGVELGPDGGVGSLQNLPLSAHTAEELCHYGALDGGTTDVDPVVVRAGGASAQSGTCNTGTRAWRLQWVAPSSDLGPATFYFAAVAGNGNAANTDDRAVARVLSTPSPQSKPERSRGCGAPAAVLLLPLAAVLARWRRGVLLVLVLAPLATWAKPKRAKRPPPAPVEAPAEPRREEPPAPIEPAAPEAPPQQTQAPAPDAGALPAAVEAPPPAPVTQAAPPPPPAEVDERPSLEISFTAGAGLRDLSLYGESYGVPLRLQQAYPTFGVRVRFFPLRLMRAGALTGLELEGAYRIGRAVGALPAGAANALPADGRLSAGYRLTFGPVAVAPRFLYRVEVGGTDRNALFADSLYQSVGGELALALEAGPVYVELRPGGGWVLDTGTLSATGYGRAAGGPTAGGTGELGVRLGATGLRLCARYQVSFTRVTFAGGGERGLGPLTVVDQGHLFMLALDVAR